MDKGREVDIKTLERDLKVAKNPLQARKIREAGEKIKHEQSDPYLRSARQALLREAKKGPKEEKSVADEIIYHKEKSHKIVSTISFNWKPGQYEELFGHS